jgi:hypothetical protein
MAIVDRVYGKRKAVGLKILRQISKTENIYIGRRLQPLPFELFGVIIEVALY